MLVKAPQKRELGEEGAREEEEYYATRRIHLRCGSKSASMLR